jgi:hypothetical protein
MSTRDLVVARALSDAAGVADDAGGEQQTAEALLRVSVTAIGPGAARYSRVVVAEGDFQGTSPRVKILWQERGTPVTSSAAALRRIELGR